MALNPVNGSAFNTVVGGAGSDAITLGAGSDTVRINLFSDLTNGSTNILGVDIITGFTSGTDKIDLAGTTLTTTGGTIIPLTVMGAADDLGSVTVERFANDAVPASLTNIAALTNQAVAVFEINVDAVSGAGNSLLNQAGVNEAIAFIAANIGTTTAANASVLLSIEDGANTAIFQYQEGALDQGIQASELTLVGVLAGVTNITAGDIV